MEIYIVSEISPSATLLGQHAFKKVEKAEECFRKILKESGETDIEYIEDCLMDGSFISDDGFEVYISSVNLENT